MGKIAVIGAGNMGSAIIRGLGGKYKIIASDVDKNKLKKLKVHTTTDNVKAVKNADIVVLAVKPQDMNPVLTQLAGVITVKQLIISITAGVTTEKIERTLRGKVPVIRVMPNTPVLVRMGMSVLCRGRYARAGHLQAAGRIFSGMGKVVVIQKEGLMDAVTAVSGSGPAYVYLFIESLVRSGCRLGLSRSVAEGLVLQTIKGAVELLEETGKGPEELREQVTSPGGTTEAALEAFKKRGFREIIYTAVKSACKRSKELQSND